MTDDLIELGAYLFGAWVAGYGMGFLIYALRSFFDKL